MHMQQIVTITSQGQITIPASMRRKIAIDKYNQASVSIEENRIIIEPISDFLDLGGSLRNKTKNKKSITEIIDLEEKSIAKMHK